MGKRLQVQLAVHWLCAIVLGALLFFVLSKQNVMAQRGVVISAAKTLAYQWASIRAAQTDAAMFGGQKNIPLAPKVLELPRSTTSWAHDAADTFSFAGGSTEFLRITKFSPVQKYRFYSLSGMPVKGETTLLNSLEKQDLQKAVQSQSITGHWTPMITDNGHNVINTFVPIGTHSNILGVMKVQIDSSVVDGNSIKWLAEGFDQSVRALLGVFLIGLIALSIRLRSDHKSTTALRYLAKHDALTGVFSRSHFFEQLDESLAEKNAAYVCLALFGLNGFKEANQFVGPAGGDELLKHVASLARKEFGQRAIIGRMSGDEFAIYRPTLKGFSKNFRKDIDSFLERIAEPVMIGNKTVRLSISCGLAFAPEDGDNHLDLMASADMAMQSIKKRRLNAWKRYENSMKEQEARRNKMLADMRESLINDDFRLYYQPQLDLGSGALCGYEALIRWEHPENGLVSPAEFIPLAEESGFIKQLGEWVMNQACRDAHSLPEHLSIAVNISAVQFQLDDVAEMVHRAVAKNGIDPSRLEVEVTESVLVENRSYVAQQLEEIAAMGIGVAIDDFGTGYSSLTYLAEFPFTKIKIDRSFVIKMEDNAQTGAIVSTIIALGQSLGAKTIAEGVETETQATLLRAAGCQLAQGYLYGRPEPLVAANDLISAKSNAS